MNKLLALSASALFMWQTSVCQQRMVADKIAAIVGDKIILKSDIDGEIMNLQRNSPDNSVPPNAACTIMEHIIAQKVMVLQAGKRCGCGRPDRKPYPLL